MSKYWVKGCDPIKIEEKWPQPPKKGLFYNFEALPSPSWWARPPITPNFFHTPNDLSNQHGLWSKAFGEGPKLAVSQWHSMLSTLTIWYCFLFNYRQGQLWRRLWWASGLQTRYKFKFSPSWISQFWIKNLWEQNSWCLYQYIIIS